MDINNNLDEDQLAISRMCFWREIEQAEMGFHESIESEIPTLSPKPIAAPTPPSESSGEYMNLNELSNYLSTPKSTLYKMTSSQTIPCLKIGNKLKFSKKEINDWLKKKRKKLVE